MQVGFALQQARKALSAADRQPNLPLRPDADAGSEQHQAARQFAAGAGAPLDENLQVWPLMQSDMLSVQAASVAGPCWALKAGVLAYCARR